MAETLKLETTVAYGDVDRHELMLLSRIFKLLQEAAIAHANQFGTGSNAVATRAETWVLNRIAVEMTRYPRVGEPLRVETWSSGIRSFKGYRDFRIFDPLDQTILSGSSVWLYISVQSKSLIRVPRDIAETFPVGPLPAWCPDLEKRSAAAPAPHARVVPVTLRYSDFDVNEHLNNAAYLDLVQTALVATGAGAHPQRVQVQFAKAIPVTLDCVEVRIGSGDSTTRFSIERDGVVYATGETSE